MNHKSVSKTILISLLLMIILAGIVQANFPVEIVDQFDRVTQLDMKPQRIVSGAPANTEILLNLGLVDNIVGVTNWCNNPEVQGIAKIGEIMSPDIEKIIALEPDLFIASNLTGKETADMLTKLGVKVVALEPHSFAAINESVEIIGRATGTLEQALVILSGVEQKLVKAQQVGKQTRAKDLKVLIMVWDDPVWTAGPGTFHHEALEIAGAINIADDSEVPWLVMDIETIVMRNPDVILADMDLDKIKTNPQFKTLAAIKKNQVYSLGDFSLPVPALYDHLIRIANLLLESN